MELGIEQQLLDKVPKGKSGVSLLVVVKMCDGTDELMHWNVNREEMRLERYGEILLMGKPEKVC